MDAASPVKSPIQSEVHPDSPHGEESKCDKSSHSPKETGRSDDLSAASEEVEAVHNDQSVSQPDVSDLPTESHDPGLSDIPSKQSQPDLKDSPFKKKSSDVNDSLSKEHQLDDLSASKEVEVVCDDESAGNRPNVSDLPNESNDPNVSDIPSKQTQPDVKDGPSEASTPDVSDGLSKGHQLDNLSASSKDIEAVCNDQSLENQPNVSDLPNESNDPDVSDIPSKKNQPDVKDGSSKENTSDVSHSLSKGREPNVDELQKENQLGADGLSKENEPDDAGISRTDDKTEKSAVSTEAICVDGSEMSCDESKASMSEERNSWQHEKIMERSSAACDISGEPKVTPGISVQDTNPNDLTSSQNSHSRHSSVDDTGSGTDPASVEGSVAETMKAYSRKNEKQSNEDFSAGVGNQSCSSISSKNLEISETIESREEGNDMQCDHEETRNKLRLSELDESQNKSPAVDNLSLVDSTSLPLSDSSIPPSSSRDKHPDDVLTEEGSNEEVESNKGSRPLILSEASQQDSPVEETNLPRPCIDGTEKMASDYQSPLDKKAPAVSDTESTVPERVDKSVADSTSLEVIMVEDDAMVIDTDPSNQKLVNPAVGSDTEYDLVIDEVSSKSPGGAERETNIKTSATGKSEPEKPPAIGDLDEEVCIVPDTEPRVPSDKEKADAFEKANKVPSGSPSVVLDCETFQKTSTVSSSTSEKLTDIAADNLTKDNELNTNSTSGGNRRPEIHLVSTSSLVSKSRKLDEKEDNRETGVSFTAQDDIQTGESGDQTCAVCCKVSQCKYHLKTSGVFLCEDECYTNYKKGNEAPAPKIRPRKLDHAFEHKCGQCHKTVDLQLEKSLNWETMDFCSEDCLENYQKHVGSNCANCKGQVPSTSLGKYCVRFGYDMKQFCCAPCLEDFKKGLKVCSYCQKDISGGAEGFLAPVGDKGQFKDFCTQECMEKYDQMSHNSAPPEVSHVCAVCNEVKTVKVEIFLDSKMHKLCSEPCFAAFKFVNSIVADQCDMCKKYYDHNRSENFTVYYDDAPHSFCCKTCMNVYILAKRKIVPCSWCKVKKYNFDMIKKVISNGQVTLMLCSLHCLDLYQASQPPVYSSKKSCELCNAVAPFQYHLTMSDASVRNFCSSKCVVTFQGNFPTIPQPGDKSPYPLGAPRKINPKKVVSVTINEKELGSNSNEGSMPIISSVTSLAPAQGPLPQMTPTPAPVRALVTPGSSIVPNNSSTQEPVKTVYKQQIIIRPPVHPEMANCAVQVKPKYLTKGVSCQPHTSSVGTQTDESLMKPILIPVPVPIYIPAPMCMYSSPYPIPVPIALPIPVPIFIPTTKNSTKGILKEINRIQEKIPSDPFEAELLMMAEMVAGEKKSENTDTDSDDDAEGKQIKSNAGEAKLVPENGQPSGATGGEALQTALLKMGSEVTEPAVGFGTAAASTDTAQTTFSPAIEEKDDSDEDTGSGRSSRSSRKRHSRRSSSSNAKRGRKSSSSDQSTIMPIGDSNANSNEEQVDKPDANMCLKFTLGVNAWKIWVSQKNADLERKGDSPKKMKLFKTELLQLNSDELNYSLCLFVKEARKPNGEAYTPDTMYYLCLGIQQYFLENGRVDNIFSDPYYEKFTDCLDEVLKQSSLLCQDTELSVTRIEEEHLWESKQLGAHSPYVLLSTLMYFNTKHFNLMTVDEHMQLSFSHIMKHWKRPPNSTTASNKLPTGSRNIVLRFYPPQSALVNNSKKKKVYEQDENEDNPLRCPVKLYEFYLSKCPESVKMRNDVFYLFPERSCVPDSPVWYSTTALGKDLLQKILNRVKMVREIANL